ncbi:MAG: TonB-dependent receptor [Gammaproteobacteria bacterium]|nr:TonB-dependent receptor [Gammaproteobacteria bacterium]
MLKRNPVAFAVATALGVSSVGGVMGNNAFAQEADEPIEEIITTGSRIVTQDGFGRTSPVTVMNSDDIASLGLTRVEDVLNSLPSVETGLHSFDANGISGTASIDLRGLGAERTLVLMNGRRFQPGGVSAQEVDVNQIPAAMIERVEVLTGGASATYGADAVAGVVNFIMRRVDGVEFSVGASGYQHDNDNGFLQGLMDDRDFVYPTGGSGLGGEAYNIDFAIGSDFADGRGNATLYATWRENVEMLQAERDYGSCALNNGATSCGGSANAIVPNFFIAPASGGTSDYSRSLFLSMQEGGALAPWDGTNLYNYAPVNHFMRPDTRYSFGGLVDFEISERATVYLEANFANNKTTGQIAESGTFFAEEYFLPLDNSLFPQQFRDDLTAYFDNQYCHETFEGEDEDGNVITNPNVCTDITQSATENGDGDASTALFQLPGYGEDIYFQDSEDPTTGEFVPFDEYGVYIGKRNVEGGPRASNFLHDSFRVVAGVKGAINENWDYDASFLFGNSRSSLAYVNDFFAPNIRVAVDGAACADDASCIPYEVFTYQGVTSEAARNMLGTAVATGETSTEVINAFVSGDLGWNFPSASDSVMVVAGFEHRDENYERVSDSVFAEGSLLGQGGPTPGVKGGYTVTEFFTEANVPLVTDAPAAQALTLDVAYRYSDYSTSGNTNTYRVGLDWQPVDMVRMRTGFNRAVRAPNVAELFSTQSLGLWSGVDPCATSEPVYTQAQCANLGVSAAQYGNITASPAGQYNNIAGGDPNLQPEEADTLTVGFVIDPMENLTLSVDYWSIEITDTISTIGETTILEQCGLFGSLCDLVVRNAGGSLWQGTQGYVIDTSVNLGENKWEGIDLAGNWTIDALDGTFTTNLIGTYMMTKETTTLPADPTSAYDCVGLVSTRCFPTPDWRHTASVNYDSGEWWSVEGRWRYFGGVDYDGSTDAIAQAEMSDSQSYFDLNAMFQIMENHDITVGVNNVLDEEPPMVGGTLTTNANTYAGFYDTLGRFMYAKATFRF